MNIQRKLVTVLANNLRYQQYEQLMAALSGNIGLFPLRDAGATAIDLSAVSDGSIIDGVNGQPAIIPGFGPSVYFSGSGNAMNAYSVARRTAFNGSTGMAGVFIKPHDAAMLNDGVTRYLVYFAVDVNNAVSIRSNGNQSLTFNYKAGGVSKTVFVAGFKQSQGIHLGVVWDKPNDKFIATINGTQAGFPSTGLGVFAGLLGVNSSLFFNTHPTTGTNPWKGWGQYAHLRSAAATKDEMHQTAYCTKQVIYDGDSRTEGRTHPMEAMAINGLRYGVGNFGVAGQALATMITNAAANIDPLLHSGGTNICVVWAGVNDAGGGADAATIYNRVATYSAARRAAGWKVIVCTEIDAQDAARNAVGWHATIMPALNTQIVANWATFADGIARLDQQAGLMDATNTTYFNADKIHLIDAGSTLVAQTIAPVITSLL